MKIRLEIQTKKFDTEEIYRLVEYCLMGSSCTMPAGIIINEKQTGNCSSLKTEVDLTKIDDTNKLIDYILHLVNYISEDTTNVEDNINTLLVTTELEFVHFDFGLVLENIHNILAGTKEYVDNSIILSDKDAEITLSVFMDELSMYTKIHKFRSCIEYIFDLINKMDFGSED